MLMSLRVAPALSFAPPFALIRVPALPRALFGMGLAACLISGRPELIPTSLQSGAIAAAAARELILGGLFATALHLSFSGLYIIGRTIDIQAGFGLSLLIDPTTRGQTPLVGTLFVYTVGAIFFALDGHHDLLRILAASLDAVPLGAYAMTYSPAAAGALLGAAATAAFGIGGAVILVMFIADLAISLLSRTVPQMNVLVLGFQVKTILLLLTLPATFAVGGSLFVRFVAMMLEAIPRLA
ncbi:flagellar biosynthetic protein FliR [Sphingomonas sanxanigenens]|nr:flagellar biosynthetic protein FliR [Sphingomonas sanxanigenens]